MIPQQQQSEILIIDLYQELVSLGKILRSTFSTDQSLRRIQQKPHHTTWILEDNFDPSAESSKFTTTKPEIFYLANPGMSIPLYNKYVMGCERSKGLLNVLAFCSLFNKQNAGKLEFKWCNGGGSDGAEETNIVEKIGIQKTMVKCSTVNWNTAPSYRGGVLSRWGDDHHVLSIQMKSGEIIYIDLMPEVNDIFQTDSLERGFLVFGPNSLSHPSKYDIVQELDTNREFITKHEPPLEIGTVSCETSFKITEPGLWSQQALPLISSFAHEFKTIIDQDNTRNSIISSISSLKSGDQ